MKAMSTLKRGGGGGAVTSDYCVKGGDTPDHVLSVIHCQLEH